MDAPQADSLRSIALFAQLDDAQLLAIRNAMELRSYNAGEAIFRQGAPADAMLILLSGHAALFRTESDGSQTPLGTASAGQCLNQEALFAETRHAASLRASQPLSLLELRRDAFTALLEARPELRGVFGGGAPAIKLAFAEQRDDEEILIRTHRHWFAFIRSAWLPLLLLPPVLLGAFLAPAQALSLILLGLSLLLPGLGLVYCYLEWRNDWVIVTDQRVIRINRRILTLFRQVTQVGLDSVHEINFEIPSGDPFARLFRYGTVFVKTAGAQGNLEMDLLPRPERFQQLVMEDRRYFEQRQAQRHSRLLQEELRRGADGAAEDDLDSHSAEAEGPPKPLRGSNGYLSSRIQLSNGDLVLRKHLSVWARHTALPLAIILVSLAALLLTFTLVSPDLRALTFAVAMIALLVGSLAYYWMDWDWRNDLYIIADDTITLVRKRPFFLQNIRDQILVERIDNVESISSGLLAALMKYGDVRMSLVGADEPKLFQRVSRPQDIQQEISRRQHNKARRRARYEARQQRQILDEYLGAAKPAPSLGGVNADAPLDWTDGAIRPAFNLDRNRPPSLPRKVLAPAPSDGQRDSAAIAPDDSRRPSRFRSRPGR